MKGVNRAIILGNLGADPELRSFSDNSQVASISVATSESWIDKQTGDKKEKTEWHRIVLRDRGNYRMAQLAGQYLRKGSKVYIEGKLQTRKYTDAQGQERYITEIIADTMQFLDSRQDGQQDQYQQQGHYQQAAPQQYHQQQAAPQQQQYQPQQQRQWAAPASYGEFDDDLDIPF